MKFGNVCLYLLKKKMDHHKKKSCVCLLLMHMGILAAQIWAFCSFCKKKGIDPCPDCLKAAKKKNCCCDGATCQDANCTDQNGVSDATRPPECEGIVTAEGEIGEES